MMAARKSAHSSPRYTWSTNEARDFVKYLEQVKRPDQPLEGRDEFLKLHPVCDACRNESCSLLPSDNYGVRCFQCRKKHISCPRQREFWLLCIAQRMPSKPVAAIAEMYKAYGDRVKPRYKDALSSKTRRDFIIIDSDSDQEANEAVGAGASQIVLHGPENRGTMQPWAKENASMDLASDGRNIKSIDSGKLSEIYVLVAKLAICRDQLRSVSRSYAMDLKSKRLTALLDQLDSIGERFSEALGDVEEDTPNHK